MLVGARGLPVHVLVDFSQTVLKHCSMRLAAVKGCLGAPAGPTVHLDRRLPHTTSGAKTETKQTLNTSGCTVAKKST